MTRVGIRKTRAEARVVDACRGPLPQVRVFFICFRPILMIFTVYLLTTAIDNDNIDGWDYGDEGSPRRAPAGAQAMTRVGIRETRAGGRVADASRAPLPQVRVFLIILDLYQFLLQCIYLLRDQQRRHRWMGSCTRGAPAGVQATTTMTGIRAGTRDMSRVLGSCFFSSFFHTNVIYSTFKTIFTTITPSRLQMRRGFFFIHSFSRRIITTPSVHTTMRRRRKEREGHHRVTPPGPFEYVVPFSSYIILSPIP